MKARTKPKKKKPFRFRLILFLLLLIPIGLGVYYVLSLPIWNIQEVVVNGAKMLSAEEIKSLSSVPISENLFLSSFARVRSNLGKITAIKKFNIYRIPPATVLIRVEERKPIAVVILEDKSAIVDGEGFILNRNPNLTLNVPNMTELPVVLGIASPEGESAERINLQASQLISNIIPELTGFLGSRHIQIDIGGFEKISFLLDDLLRVKIGRDEEIKKKMDVFKALLPVIEDKWSQVEHVDVRYPDNPVIRYR